MRPSWKTSPTGQRIWRKFESGFKGTIKELAQSIPCHTVSAGEYVKQLRRENLIYICNWVRSRRGNPSAVWVKGNRPDRPQLMPLTSAELSERWFSNLCRKVGYERARMIKNALRRGSSQLVIDGQVIWRRFEGVKPYENSSPVRKPEGGSPGMGSLSANASRQIL